jgi:hypothetical protein
VPFQEWALPLAFAAFAKAIAVALKSARVGHGE